MRFRVPFSWLFGLAAIACWSGIERAQAATSEHPAISSITGLPGDLPAVARVAAPDYRAIVDRYGPAVVGVTVEDDQKGADRSEPNPFDDGAPPPGVPGRPTADSQGPIWGQGSGFIFNPDGLVLTNAHVVRGASTVTVTLSDRREFKAKVLGIDSATDVAVLKIDGKDLPTVRLADSDRLQVGDYVLAIGTPYGFDETATSGIVSAMHRQLPNSPYIPFIQTDAAVNPGNSGGPLFNAGGDVVGINAQIYSHSGGFEGLSFAIPIGLARHIADQIISTGQVRHGWLGVTVQQLTQPLAESFGLKRPDGALISRVKPHSAAALAGLQAGDIILKCNSVTIRQAVDVSALVGVAAPDDALSFLVWRNGEEHNINARLNQTESGGGDDAASPTSDNRLGLAVKVLSPDELKEANVSSGLIIVKSSGAAESAGILTGDLLLAVNGVRMQSTDQLRSSVANSAPRIALLIQRGDTRTYIPILTN